MKTFQFKQKVLFFPVFKFLFQTVVESLSKGTSDAFLRSKYSVKHPERPESSHSSRPSGSVVWKFQLRRSLKRKGETLETFMSIMNDQQKSHTRKLTFSQQFCVIHAHFTLSVQVCGGEGRYRKAEKFRNHQNTK